MLKSFPTPDASLLTPHPFKPHQSLVTAAAFTLIEILVVLFLVSVMLFAALPNFLQLSEEPLKREAMRLASLIRYENDQAVARKETRSISFDMDRNAWTTAGPDNSVSNAGSLKSGIEFLDIITGPMGKKKEGIQMVGFTPSGLTDAAIIHISDSDAVFSVILHPYAGQVETREGYVE